MPDTPKLKRMSNKSEQMFFFQNAIEYVICQYINI